MSFELEIQFSGPNLFVAHPDHQRVLLLMTNARRARRGKVALGVSSLQPDGKEGIWHAGYMRFSLLNAMPGITAQDDPGDGPEFEVVRRFDLETLDFPQIERDDIEWNQLEGTRGLNAPEMGRVDPSLRPKASVLTAQPSNEVLARMELRGGSFDGNGSSYWEFTHTETDNDDKYGGSFPGVVTWRRKVEHDHLQIEISKFDGSSRRSLRLSPVDGVVQLKIANLCSINPLEWDELDAYTVTRDADFKWVYRLLEAKNAGGSVHKPGHDELPIPVVVNDENKSMELLGIIEDCFPAQIEASY